jgi:hypothetical protein
MRLRAGADKGELVWRRPNRMTLHNILHSPVYAGIYANGRRRVDPRRQLPGRPSTGRVVRAQDECGSSVSVRHGWPELHWPC